MKEKIKQFSKSVGDSLEKTTTQIIKNMNMGKSKLKKLGHTMIGPIEKGFQKAKVETPPIGVYENVDLKVLPKYIAYKAALIKEKGTLQFLLMIVVFIFVGHYLVTRVEISSLHSKLREKEYILAPGVLDFTAASPQSVTDTYINNAVSDFLSSLGNVSHSNIIEQYSGLKQFMSEELKVQFEMETKSWLDQVKSESISQLFHIREKEITSDNNGAYKVVALVKADFYSDGQYLGHEDQVVEMTLKLVPPERGKRWYLQIISLVWEKEETFDTRSKLSTPKRHSK